MPDVATITEVDPGKPSARLYPLSSLIDAAVAVSEGLYEARTEGRPVGPITGLPALDHELCGAFTPGLHVLHGAPGAGKTALALQIACACRCPALYLTCEMWPIELLRRIAARVTTEYLNRFKSGEHTPARARELFTKAAESAPMLTILDATTAPVLPRELQDFAQAARETAPDNPYLLVVVDSVHSWARAWQKDATEYETLNAGLNALREVAQRLGAAVLGIGERNRASKDGGLTATAGTRVFEYGAETLLSLNREKDARPDAHGELDVTLKIEKNRNGAPGREVRLRFHGAMQRFTEA